jgi:hypothetical protein
MTNDARCARMTSRLRRIDDEMTGLCHARSASSPARGAAVMAPEAPS